MTTRYPSVDVVRGIAVMGILAMNIIGFSMPEQASLTPDTWRADSFANRELWALSFIFVDNKMRGLFSLLYGASILMLIHSTDAAGGNGLARHHRRSLWLLLFGLIHYYLIWNGDILTLYALVGFLAVLFRDMGARRLISVSLLCFIGHFALWASLLTPAIETERMARDSMASAAIVAAAEKYQQDWGSPNSPDIEAQTKLYRSGYGEILQARAVDDAAAPLRLLVLFWLETLGLMLLGIALLKSGLLTAEWQERRIKTLAWRCGLFGLAGMGGLTVLCAALGWTPVATTAASVLWSIPFREAMTVAYAALIILLYKRFAQHPAIARIAAVGQTAFSNYIGTSVVMTLIFYGYGLGLYGHVSRVETWLICIAAWAVMLIWSPAWLARFHQGPLEWLWRSLTAGQLAPFRRMNAARPS